MTTNEPQPQGNPGQYTQPQPAMQPMAQRPVTTQQPVGPQEPAYPQAYPQQTGGYAPSAGYPQQAVPQYPQAYPQSHPQTGAYPEQMPMQPQGATIPQPEPYGQPGVYAPSAGYPQAAAPHAAEPYGYGVQPAIQPPVEPYPQVAAFPQQSAAYPQQSAYPQPAAHPQQAAASPYPQGVYPQTAAPQYPQSQYTQTAAAQYPQQGAAPQYPQGAYAHSTYPQATYQQAAYPQVAYPQPAYAQMPYPQVAYPQTQYPQVAYPQTAYARPAFAMPIDPRRMLNKWRRAVVNRAMGVTFAYEGMMYAGALISEIVVMTVLYAGKDMSDAEFSRWNGVFSIASLVTAVGFLLIVRHRDIFTREYWLGGPHLDTYGEPDQKGRMSQYGSGRRMTVPTALAFMGLAMGVQGVITLIQLLFALLGADLASPTSDSIDESMTTVSMWLYVCLLAPICEEMIFRGVLLKSLKPLGKNFAIITSAVMFGFFHGDIVQGVFAALSGLLLGYLAMEYSLVWSIALHFFNNAILAGVMDTLASTYLDDTGYTIYAIATMLFGIVVSIVVLVLNRKRIGAYVRANRVPGAFAGWASWTLIGFALFNGAQAVYSFVTAMMS
ncbi:CPBP family intramembrane glutamic endopeptidase [Bifidobacterium sp. CP2]|uniref:CPBP family intramembrane glutamic endopeptidase n=1 Tax=Bifidobacterium sp. CP2 TaxID=2809025 RepID=UPI001F0A41B4|nr:CPBP family intramembrane glutamic endopeptidase [Bifidobacterium sp. CP2]